MAATTDQFTRGECVFCGGRPITEEHVWPKWLIALLPEVEEVIGTMGGPELGRTIEFQSGSQVNHTIRRTCESCNTGWMSDLEARVKPLVSPMVKPQRPAIVRLGQADQALLALWAVKMALMLDFATPGEQYIPRSAFEWVLSQGTPPPQVRVWIGARTMLDDIPEDATSGVVQAVWADSNLVTFHPSTGDLDAYVTTFSAGFLVCQVVGLLYGFEDRPVEVGTFGERGIIHIWPSTNRLIPWPPPFVFSDRAARGSAELEGDAALILRTP